jgi:hypothetical protein
MARAWALALFLALPAGLVNADEVTHWNGVALGIIRDDGTAPPRASRTLAIMHIAIYDAVNSIAKSHRPYHFAENAPATLSKRAAVAAAAHATLSALYPAYEEDLDDEFDDAVSDIPEGEDKEDAILLGIAAAADILALREDDPDGTEAPGQAPNSGPGVWEPTLPGFANYLLPGWAEMPPFTMRSPDQFRRPAPPALNSGQYTRAYNEVKSLGAKNSTTRTADQTEIALFWADGPRTVTPPGHWNVIAQTVSDDEELTLAENARLFAHLNLALADAAIAAWDMKWEYYFWRPVTAIHNAADDGNRDTAPDPAWEPLINTPPFPGYVSGHSTFSDAAATVLAHWFGDKTSFSTGSDGLPGTIRFFDRFSEAADEAGRSRIYGGIHCFLDDGTGQKAGSQLAKQVVQHFLTKR